MDEHVPKAVTEGLRRRGVDVITVQELGLQTAEDARHLERAAQDGRVVVTQDADFLRLHASGLPHRCVCTSTDTGVPHSTVPHVTPRRIVLRRHGPPRRISLIHHSASSACLSLQG